MFRYDRLEPLIKASGKSKVYLCKKMGLSSTYLRDAKKQNTNISGEPLRILAKELDTTPEYLKGETDDPEAKKAPGPETEGMSETQQEAARLLSTMTDEQLRLLIRLGEAMLEEDEKGK